MLTRLTTASLNDASSSRNVTQTHRQPSSRILRITSVARKTASSRVVDESISFMMIRLSDVASSRIPRIRRRSSCNKLPLRSADVFTPLEMHEDAIEEKELQPRAGGRQPQASKVVQLPEGPSEGCLSALVGPGDNERSFPALQAEVVSDDRSFLGQEPGCKGQVKDLVAADLLCLP